jgi:hypothetical protein
MFHPGTIDTDFGRIRRPSHSTSEWASLNMNSSISNAECMFAGFLWLQIERKCSILMIVELRKKINLPIDFKSREGKGSENCTFTQL